VLLPEEKTNKIHCLSEKEGRKSDMMKYILENRHYWRQNMPSSFSTSSKKPV